MARDLWKKRKQLELGAPHPRETHDNRTLYLFFIPSLREVKKTRESLLNVESGSGYAGVREMCEHRVKSTVRFFRFGAEQGRGVLLCCTHITSHHDAHVVR